MKYLISQEVYESLMDAAVYALTTTEHSRCEGRTSGGLVYCVACVLKEAVTKAKAAHIETLSQTPPVDQL